MGTVQGTVGAKALGHGSGQAGRLARHFGQAQWGDEGRVQDRAEKQAVAGQCGPNRP